MKEHICGQYYVNTNLINPISYDTIHAQIVHPLFGEFTGKLVSGILRHDYYFQNDPKNTSQTDFSTLAFVWRQKNLYNDQVIHAHLTEKMAIYDNIYTKQVLKVNPNSKNIIKRVSDWFIFKFFSQNNLALTFQDPNEKYPNPIDFFIVTNEGFYIDPKFTEPKDFKFSAKWNQTSFLPFRIIRDGHTPALFELVIMTINNNEPDYPEIKSLKKSKIPDHAVVIGIKFPSLDLNHSTYRLHDILEQNSLQEKHIREHFDLYVRFEDTEIIYNQINE